MKKFELRQIIKEEIQKILKEYEYISPTEQKEMKKYYKIADRIVQKVQNKINTKGAYENAGQNEITDFEDSLRKTELSYQAQVKLSKYINNKIDNLDYSKSNK